MKPFRILLLAAVVCAAAIALCGADTLITTKSHTDAMPMAQKPASDEVQTQWIAKDRYRMNAKGSGILVRMDQKKLYVIDDAGKKAQWADLPLDFAKMVSPDKAAAINAMMAQAKMTATLVPTGETKKIGPWTARRYRIEMKSPMGMTMNWDVWATRDVKLDYTVFKQMVANVQGLNPTMSDFAREFMKIDGCPVLTEMKMNVMGASFGQRDEVTAIEDKAPPAGTYEVPQGYALEKLDMSKFMMRGGA